MMRKQPTRRSITQEDSPMTHVQRPSDDFGVVHGRIDDLDGQVNKMSIDLASVSSSVQHISIQLNGLGDTLKSLSTSFNNRQQTNWSVIVAFMSVGLTVIGVFITLAINPIKEEVAKMQVIRDRVNALEGARTAEEKVYKLQLEYHRELLGARMESAILRDKLKDQGK